MKRFDRAVLKKKTISVDWKLFLFMVLVMNVKLVVKIIAVVFILILERKSFSARRFFSRPYVLFYMGMIVIACINFLFQYKDIRVPYVLVTAMGVLLWVIPAVTVYFVVEMIRKGDSEKMHQTVTLFFLVHAVIIFISLLLIVLEIHSINPYTYKGLNQKYYISTGDYIQGITFDDAVTTAMIAAFGVLYFLYRRRFFYSLVCMTGVLVIFSNLTNIFLLLIFIFIFMFRSDRIQKSMVVVYTCMFLVFITTVSPQNNEYVVSFIYKMIGKAYYLPPEKVITRDELKQMPDSSLTYTQQREKRSLLYIDSLSNAVKAYKPGTPEKNPVAPAATVSKTRKVFYEYRPTDQVREKENRFNAFIADTYKAAQTDSLAKHFNWDKPGKLTAAIQLKAFYKQHPSKKWLGAGVGNFSSRIAFKATALGIGGRYPAKYRYLNPDFQNGHLYVYLYYHAQWQINHTAANTPDSTYYQLAGEYGWVGLGLFLFLYAGYFLRKSHRYGYSLPVVFLLLAAFSVEYWFERLSVVVLFELLFFLDQATALKEERTHE